MSTSTSSHASFSLKFIGIISILSFLTGFLFLLFPLEITDQLWQINLYRSLVEQGFLPLLGIGAIVTAFYIDRTRESSDSSSPSLKLPIFILSSLLGLMFLLIFPLYLININQIKEQGLTRINKEAEQLENQVKNQLSQIQNQLSNDQVKASVEKQRAALKEQLR
ncbi:MAG: HpsJ family protein, partial [Dolichospermum sp.]